MKRLVIFFMAAVVMAGAECIPIARDKIVARDLAAAVPAFSALDPETVIGFTPLPGVQRVLTSRELLVIAKRQGLETDTTIANVCVERAVQPLSLADLSAALTAALGIEDARLEILAYSNQAVPPGRLEFAVAGLNKPPADTPDAPVIWRGRLVYDSERSLAIWAKVRIMVQRSAVMAVERIQIGATIRAEQLRISQIAQFPFSGHFLDSMSQVAGKIARQTIGAGQPINPASLADAMEVQLGERVHVHVVDGLATLSLEAVAQSAGSRGDVISVRNPVTGKSFRGVVEDKGKVIVRSSEGIE